MSMKAGICFLVVVVNGFVTSAVSQTAWVGGPVLGVVLDRTTSSIRPILGVPGASSLGAGLDLGRPVHRAAISPKQDYIIAVAGEEATVSIIRISSGSVWEQAVEGARADAKTIAISATGSAAILYEAASGIIQVLSALPESARVSREIDMSWTPGTPTSMTVSDDARLVIAGFDEGEASRLYVIGETGEARPVVWAGRFSSMAMLAWRHDVIYTDGEYDEAFLLVDPEGTATRLLLATSGDGLRGPSGVIASEDNRQAYVTGLESGTVTIVNLEGGTPTTVGCGCRATGIHRLRGQNVYRVNESSEEPMTLFEAAEGEPRILVVPPEVAATPPKPEMQ